MISVSRDGGILSLLFDRPEQRNAMSHGVVREMIEALEETNAACRAVLIAGKHHGFCAGSDLTELAAMPPQSRSDFEADSGKLARLLQEIELPVIAAVHGFAIGGGLTLAAACDIVVTEPDARWSLPEVALGLFPAWGLGAVAERVGKPAARRLSWGIETLSGVDALRIGLADHMSETPLVMAKEMAASLAALPTAQARAVKAYFAGDYRAAAGDRRANAFFMAALEVEAARVTLARFRDR